MNELPPLSDYLRGLTEAAEVEIDLSKPLKLYIRSTELVFKQVSALWVPCVRLITHHVSRVSM